MTTKILSTIAARRRGVAPGYQFLVWPDGASARWPSDNKKIQVTTP
jgi:hypothetical protein